MLLRRLCDQGHDVVCLVRANDQIEARERLRAIMGNQEDVRVVHGDITKPQCGLGIPDYQLLFRHVNRVIHCAASLNFQDKDKTNLTNVTGLQHVLELMDLLDTQHVVYISTAYVVGDAPYLSEERPPDGQRWNNCYEESKFVGEGMVRAWALRRKERRFTIFRPSILVGCEDGTSSTLDGYYKCVEPLHRVAESLRNRNGKPLPADVFVGDNGQVRVPLAVVMADMRINFVPIDWAANMMAAAIALPGRNETFHFVHHNPTRIRDALAWTLDHLRIDGVSVCDTQYEKDIAVAAQTPFVHRLQRRIDAVYKAYIPYCTIEPRFQMEAAPRRLRARFRPPPTVDREFLERLLSYAVEKFWTCNGKNSQISLCQSANPQMAV